MELGGQILDNRQRYDELSRQMRHVEAVIKMLEPGYNLARITVKRRQPNKFKRGTLYRRAVDVLRTATGPMTTAEIGAAILAAEATTADAQTVALSIQHEGKGVERVDGYSPARWRLKETAN